MIEGPCKKECVFLFLCFFSFSRRTLTVVVQGDDPAHGLPPVLEDSFFGIALGVEGALGGAGHLVAAGFVLREQVRRAVVLFDQEEPLVALPGADVHVAPVREVPVDLAEEDD